MDLVKYLASGDLKINSSSKYFQGCESYGQTDVEVCIDVRNIPRSALKSVDSNVSLKLLAPFVPDFHEST